MNDNLQDIYPKCLPSSVVITYNQTPSPPIFFKKIYKKAATYVYNHNLLATVLSPLLFTEAANGKSKYVLRFFLKFSQQTRTESL